MPKKYSDEWIDTRLDELAEGDSNDDEIDTLRDIVWELIEQRRKLVDPSQLIGAAEAVQISGLNRGAFNTLRVRGQVPEPIATLACGPIWTRSQIEEWAATRAAERPS